jgi:hypothetical protein
LAVWQAETTSSPADGRADRQTEFAAGRLLRRSALEGRCNDRSASKAEILLARIAVALIIDLAVAGVVWEGKK